MLGDTGPCAKFQLDGFTGSGSFFTSVFPWAGGRAQDRDGGEVNIRDLKIVTNNDHIFYYPVLSTTIIA